MKLNARASLPLPSPSGHATLDFVWARFVEVHRELPPLLKRHWQEIATHQDTTPLIPEWRTFFGLDLAGALRMLTVRANGQMVGYAFVLVMAPPLYSTTLWATCNTYWLDPLYREGWNGVRLFREIIDAARAWNCRSLHISATLHFAKDRGTVGKILKRLGFQPIETNFELVL